MSDAMICPAMVGSFCMMVAAACSLALIASSSAGNRYNISDLTLAGNQLTKEWKTDFIYDVYVVNSNENCEKKHTDGKYIFSYDWNGLKPLYKRPDNG